MDVSHATWYFNTKAHITTVLKEKNVEMRNLTFATSEQKHINFKKKDFLIIFKNKDIFKDVFFMCHNLDHSALSRREV